MKMGMFPRRDYQPGAISMTLVEAELPIAHSYEAIGNMQPRGAIQAGQIPGGRFRGPAGEPIAHPSSTMFSGPRRFRHLPGIQAVAVRKTDRPVETRV